MIEKEILGCFLKDNSLLQETKITVSQFSKEAYQLLFQSMIKLSHEGKAVDKVTLLSENYQYLSSLGGIDFITELEMIGNVDNFETYERNFIEKFVNRESERLTRLWLSHEDRSTERLIQELQKLEEHQLTDFETKDEVLTRMFELPYTENIEDSGIRTGLTDLDNIIGGFQNTNSYILGARPSMGKTATMLKFALSAMNSGATPIMFSLEMSKESLIRRLIATIGKINLFFTRNPHNLSNAQKQSWQEAINELYKLDFEVDDTPLQTIQHIRSRIRKEKSKRDNQIIVFIDYLTLIDSNQTFQSDHSKFTHISAQLKAIAREYNCPVVTLAQLSRGVEQRNDKRPLLSDLRESGSIEQDADGVMFLYRENYYNKEVDDNTLEIIVAKHRDGPTGTAKVYYNKATGIMGDLSDT